QTPPPPRPLPHSPPLPRPPPRPYPYPNQYQDLHQHHHHSVQHHHHYHQFHHHLLQSFLHSPFVLVFQDRLDLRSFFFSCLLFFLCQSEFVHHFILPCTGFDVPMWGKRVNAQRK